MSSIRETPPLSVNRSAISPVSVPCYSASY
jgi:hypothetical protein